MQPQSPAQQVASNVRAELARRRLAVSVAAARLGISDTAMRRRLSGQVPFTVGEIADVSAWLNVRTSDLMGEPAAAGSAA